MSFLVLPSAFWFCREIFVIAVTVVGHRRSQTDSRSFSPVTNDSCDNVSHRNKHEIEELKKGLPWI